MGYVHRDLKPENIVLNLKPLEVVVIDFDRAVLDTLESFGTALGTAGYYPDKDNLRDGSWRWDAWAYAAIILESDMTEKKYMAANREQTSIRMAEAHLQEAETCPEMRELIKKTILEKDIAKIMGIQEIMNLLAQISFRRYDAFK